MKYYFSISLWQTSGPWMSVCSLCLCCPGAGGWAVWRCGSVWGHHCFSPGHRCSMGSRVSRPRVRKTHPSDYWSADINTRHKCSQLHPIHCQFVLDRSHVVRLCVNTVNAYKTNFFILKARNYDIYRLDVFVEDVTYTTITIIYRHCNTFNLCFYCLLVCCLC